MINAMRLSLPWKLITIHSMLILLFMFTLSRRWFSHWSEAFFPAGTSVMVPWNLIPGCVCLLLGGVQWYWIARLWMWSGRSHVVGHATS